MEKNNLIVTDVDGVLLDYMDSFIAWAKVEHGWEIDPDHPHDSYDMSSWFKGGKTTKEFVELITEYNSEGRVIPPIEGSVKALNRLYEDGHRIIALTSFGGYTGSQEFRREYLKVLFGDIFDDTIILPLGACKKDKLKELSPKYFVEDCLAYAEQGSALGIKTFLVRTTYNAGGEDIIYVNNWNEILYIISELEGEKNYEQI